MYKWFRALAPRAYNTALHCALSSFVKTTIKEVLNLLHIFTVWVAYSRVDIRTKFSTSASSTVPGTCIMYYVGFGQQFDSMHIE
jgi:hypothetical protein